MIEFDLVRATQIIDVSQIKLYDKFEIYMNDKIYETVLSGIKQNYERSNLTRFIFGKVRMRFNDKIKLSNIFN